MNKTCDEIALAIVWSLKKIEDLRAEIDDEDSRVKQAGLQTEIVGLWSYVTMLRSQLERRRIN